MMHKEKTPLVAEPSQRLTQLDLSCRAGSACVNAGGSACAARRRPCGGSVSCAFDNRDR